MAAMWTRTAALLLSALLWARGGAWPTHTACSDGDMRIFYQSCDPLQDFGFSVDPCSRQLKSNRSIRFGLILREDIRELFLELALFTHGASMFNFSYPVCEQDQPKFSFCGRRKGEQIYYAGPVELPPLEVPQICSCSVLADRERQNPEVSPASAQTPPGQSVA